MTLRAVLLRRGYGGQGGAGRSGFRCFGISVFRCFGGEVAVGFEAEDVVPLVEDGSAVGFGAVLVRKPGVGEGVGFSGGVAVFLDVESFFADAGQGGKEAEIDIGIRLGIGNGELGKEFAHADAGELEAEFLDFFRLVVFCQVTGEIEPGGDDFEAILVPEPILVAAVVPVGDVFFGDFVWQGWVGGFFKALNDLGVGSAVGEELVDKVAELFGETGDFAVAAAARLRQGYGGRARLC